MKYSLVEIEGNLYIKNNYIGDSLFLNSLKGGISCQCCVFLKEKISLKYKQCYFRKYDCVGAYFTKLPIDTLLKALEEE